MNSILNFENRGKWGKSSYRGNCSGYVQQALFNMYKPDFVTDFMCGSDTTSDVCKDMKIKHATLDLNKGFDILNDDINIRYDFNFWHPPYWDIVVYSGNQYGTPHASDLSRIQDYKEFMKATNYALAKQFASLKTGGRMAILMGDIKKNKKLYSMLLDIDKIGTIENILIKAQHNCWSDRNLYKGNFFKITHEYILILRKDNPYLYEIKITKDVELDIRDSKNITWKDLVASILDKLGGKATLENIYQEVEGHKKTKTNNHWKAKIRQTVQIYNKIFKNVDSGTWALC